MSLKNTPDGYGWVSRVNHWLSALVFIVLIPMGMVMEEMDDERGGAFFQLLEWHKGLAVLLMGLVLLRLLWMALDRTAVRKEPVDAWQSTLTNVVRLVLWAGLIGMPLSGWIMSNSAGYPVGFFGLFDLPFIVPESEFLHEAAESAHEALPGLLILAIVLHVAGALKHHFVDNDRVLTRMSRGAG